jgi:hypothetical protein
LSASSSGSDPGIRLEWTYRELLWELSTLERVRKCSRVSHTGNGAILRLSGDGADRVAGYAGLIRCASTWACLGCSTRINAEWCSRLKALLAAVASAGGGASFVTLTARHHLGQRLTDLWDGVRARTST